MRPTAALKEGWILGMLEDFRARMDAGEVSWPEYAPHLLDGVEATDAALEG